MKFMNKKWKSFALFFALAFTVSSFSIQAFAEPESTTVPAQTPAEVNSLPEAGVPVTPSSSAPSSKTAHSSVSSKSSKPAVSKKPVARKPATVSSDVSSDLSSTLPELPSGVLPSSSMPEIVLPTVSVGSENDGQIIDSESVPYVNNRATNWIGIIAWVCIVLGVLVVLIVVLSNRRPPRGGNGRKRYRRPRKVKKHLLNDKYYRNLKY